MPATKDKMELGKQIQAAITTIIADEPKDCPLTDFAIANRLKALGFAVNVPSVRYHRERCLKIRGASSRLQTYLRSNNENAK